MDGRSTEEPPHRTEEFMRRLYRIENLVAAVLQRRHHSVHETHGFAIHLGFNASLGEQHKKFAHGAVQRCVALRENIYALDNLAPRRQQFAVAADGSAGGNEIRILLVDRAVALQPHPSRDYAVSRHVSWNL